MSYIFWHAGFLANVKRFYKKLTQHVFRVSSLQFVCGKRDMKLFRLLRTGWNIDGYNVIIWLWYKFLFWNRHSRYRGHNGEINEYIFLTIQILLHVKMATLPQVLKKNAHIKKIVNFTLTVQKCFTLFSMHDQEYRILSGYGYCGFE